MSLNQNEFNFRFTGATKNAHDDISENSNIQTTIIIFFISHLLRYT
jgi:hypothetical protein